jgi:mRNA interferase YafQ
MLHPITTRQFQKDLEKARRQNKDFSVLNTLMRKLIEEKILEPKYCDHPLRGEWKGFRDCHVQNDWVLIYKIDKALNTITFTRLGSHSELFR